MKNKLNVYILISIFTTLMIIMCIYVIIKNNNFKEYGCIDIGMYNRDWEKQMGFTLEEFLSTKKITDYNLTGNEIQDKSLLKKFQLGLRSLVKTKDSIKCLHIKFGNNSKYEDFVRAIEICKIEDAKIYVPFENNLWVTNIARKDFIKAHPPKFQNKNHIKMSFK